MNERQKRQWFMRGAVLLLVFLAALSMDKGEHAVGWRFLALCSVVGLLGGLASLWVRRHIQQIWARLSNWQRFAVVAAAIAVVLVASFITNHGKADEAANDVLTVFGVAFVLLLWGFYRLLSRFLDSVWERWSRR